MLMVISDHGFNTFRYGVDLNRWLEENGYLALKENDREGKYLTAIDWSKTKAFGLGLTGIFLNIKGRESHSAPRSQTNFLLSSTHSERTNRPSRAYTIR
jgi:predicted AlkP superfamily phosphohydrolase/phosphomutase